MGWERKRGKIEEFNRLLRGATDTSFHHVVGDRSVLRSMRYCLTLDSDTRLPRDAARELVGIILHPLNQPEVDPVLRRVTQGYGILQPRVSVTMSSAAGSLFARVYAGHTGVDPYTTAVSDVYQDLFGEGIFAGKGLYHVDAFMSTLDGRVPENALLSHDLFEGLHARAALVSDIELVDDYPPTVLAHVRRQRRWVRGDWQILLWLFPYVPTAQGMARNQLPFISRWKILDNLRRSLMAPALLAFLLAGWTFLPGRPVVWTAMALGVTGSADAAGDGAVARRAVVRALVRRVPARRLRRHADRRGAGAAVADAVAVPRVGDGAGHHPHAGAAGGHASPVARMGDGVERGGGVGRPARPGGAARVPDRDGVEPARRAAGDPAGCCLAARRVDRGRRRSCWRGSPRRSSPGHSASHARRGSARWRRTSAPRFAAWRGRRGTTSRSSSAPTTTGCHRTTSRRRPGRQLARRTSPTNIGMGLLATLAARDLGFIDDRELIERSTTRWTRARSSNVTRDTCSTGTTRARWPRCGPATSRPSTAATW